MLKKPNKLDYMTVKSYHIISLLNCPVKVCEKVVANMQLILCDISDMQHEGQMGYRKQSCTMDAVERVIS